MPRLISVHLLGLCLLLSQLPGEIQGQRWDTVIKACGRELVRMQIRVCGNSLSMWREMQAKRLRREAGPPTEFLPTSLKIDEETLKMLTEFVKSLNTSSSLNHATMTKLQQTSLEEANIFFKEFQKMICTSDSRGLDNTELINIGWDKKSRKKRQVSTSLSSKCCYSGCTLRDIARFC
ncbi:prorelaxin H2 [Suncus etruscus]|uniref:prorelaxin H2 n=1 Tax=Suncus etruscus TaxID=109475 RepID=UPI00211062D5|nr:prorelaxin H2 [Suncus etruscus]